MKVLNIFAALLLCLTLAPSASAEIIAYEGFDHSGVPDGTSLAGLTTSVLGTTQPAFGFIGGWTVTNGENAASAYRYNGLTYPSSYEGAHVNVGGHGQNTGLEGKNSFLRLNLSGDAADSVNAADNVYVSFLAQRIGLTTSDILPDSQRGPLSGNRASEYPRNFGARFLSSPGVNNNNSLGTIGKPSDRNSNGVVFDPNQPDPILIDTWGVGGWKDTNAVYSGADFADGVDHVVVHFDRANSKVDMWINPTMAGGFDGVVSFDYEDSGNPQFPDQMIYAFGVEAGSGGGDRNEGDWVFDEIYFATSFSEATGISTTAFDPVPEPGSLAALCGLVALAGVRRRR